MQNQKIFSNTFFQILTKITTSGIGFIATILIAKYFGAIGYGNFTKITAFVGLFYLISDFGINAIFLQIDEKKADFRNLLYLRLLLSIIIMIGINTITLILPYNMTTNVGFAPQLRLGMSIFSLTLLSQSVLTSSAAIFQKKLRYDLQTLTTIIGSIATLIMIILVSLARLPLEYILASYVIGGSISALLSLKVQGEKMLPFIFQKESAMQLLKDSLPLGIMLFFNLVYFRIDTVILSFFKSATDVGIYGYAYKFFDFLIAIPLFLSNSLYPLLLKNQKNLRYYYLFSQKYMWIFLFFSLIILIPAWILAPIIALVKSDFTQSVPTFRILLLSLPIFFLTSILQWVLISKNKKLFLLNVYLFSALLNCFLNLIFIPRFSYHASAIITGISELFVLILLIYKFIRMKHDEQPQS
jgi:O-antigen/teichoic acid export membrane protein